MARMCMICGAANSTCGHGAPPRYKPITLEREAPVMAHTLKRDTYVDIDGNVVDERDPSVQTFVGAAGAQIPDEDARRYGLIGGKKAEEVEHDEGIDPENAAAPVVGGVPTPDAPPAAAAVKHAKK